MTITCPSCSNEYKRISTHWSQSSCEHVDFTNHQQEIITGLLMGDGWIDNPDDSNPLLRCEMISPNYLEYIDEQFGIFGNGVSLKMSANDAAKMNRDSGLRPNAKSENYHNVYQWYSIAHPELQEFAEWYSTGKKVWPEDIELTPTVLKHWYCGDGHWNNSGSSNYIQISMKNEMDNTESVNKMFKNVGLQSPNYNISETKCDAMFTVEQSKELWEYMGEPLPGFRYKWPKVYR